MTGEACRAGCTEDVRHDMDKDEERMEEHLVSWLKSDTRNLEKDDDGFVEASCFAAMRKSRRMGFSEEMILKVGAKSDRLVRDGKKLKLEDSQSRVEKIGKYLEFWFGATNLRRDKFLGKVIRASSDGTVPLDTLLTFNKLKDLRATRDELVEAVRSLPELLRLSGDGDHVGRATPIDEEALPEGDVDDRMVYIEPLPSETSHEQVTELVQKFGRVGYVSMPRYESGEIKGFAFVEFETAKAAQDCVADGATLKLRDAEELKVISKHQWLELKEAVKKARKEGRERAKHAQQVANFGYAVGVLIKIDGLEGSVKRQEVYDALQAVAPVAFVEFKRSAPNTCYARFHTATNAAAASDALNHGSVQIKAAKVAARVLYGREEAEQWRKIHEETTRKAEAKRSAAGAESAQSQPSAASAAAEPSARKGNGHGRVEGTGERATAETATQAAAKSPGGATDAEARQRGGEGGGGDEAAPAGDAADEDSPGRKKRARKEDGDGAKSKPKRAKRRASEE